MTPPSPSSHRAATREQRGLQPHVPSPDVLVVADESSAARRSALSRRWEEQTYSRACRRRRCCWWPTRVAQPAAARRLRCVCVGVTGLLRLFIVTKDTGQQRNSLGSSASSSKETYRKEDYNGGLMCRRPEQRRCCDLNTSEDLERCRSMFLRLRRRMNKPELLTG